MSDADTITAPAPVTPKRETPWLVYDTLAREGRRRHMPVPMHEYELSATEPTPMPRAHALKFLADPAFRVIDDAGQPVRPLPKNAVNSITGGVMLRTDQVAANVDELTDAALAARCALMPRSEDVVTRADRDEMVRFIVDRQTAIARAAAAAQRNDDDDVDILDQKALDKLLPRFAA